MGVRSAVILAAGESKRLRSFVGGISKIFLKIKGIPLILFPIFTLSAVGVEKFYVVTSKVNYKMLRDFLEKLNVDYKIIINNHVERENGFSLYLGVKAVDEGIFFLSMADHIYTPKIPLTLLSQFDEVTDILIAADRNPRFIEVGEATKIITGGDSYVIRIGKNLKKFDYVDTGVFLMRKDILGIAVQLVKSVRKFKVSDVINTAINLGYDVRVADVTGMEWTELDTPSDVISLAFHRRKVLDTVIKEWGELAWPWENQPMELSLDI